MHHFLSHIVSDCYCGIVDVLMHVHVNMFIACMFYNLYNNYDAIAWSSGVKKVGTAAGYIFAQSNTVS